MSGFNKTTTTFKNTFVWDDQQLFRSAFGKKNAAKTTEENKITYSAGATSA